MTLYVLFGLGLFIGLLIGREHQARIVTKELNLLRRLEMVDMLAQVEKDCGYVTRGSITRAWDDRRSLLQELAFLRQGRS